MDFSQRAAIADTNEINAVLCPLLDAAVVEAWRKDYAATRGSGEGDVAKYRIGAGYIGTECHRALGFQYHKAAKEVRESGVTAGELQRHAQAGHWTEFKTAEWMKLTGMLIETMQHDASGEVMVDQWGRPKQIGWKDSKDPETGQYRLAGEVDGVITYVGDQALAALIKTPCVWESKKATDKKWKKFVKEKVIGADKKYYGQLQVNMGYLGITQTLFSMLNLDTMKYYFELIPFDQWHAQNLVNRAVDTFKTKTPFELPRLGRSEDDWVCKFCDYQQQCWHESVPVRAAPVSGFFNPNEMEDPPF